MSSHFLFFSIFDNIDRPQAQLCSFVLRLCFLWKERKIRKLQGKIIKITQLKQRIASHEQILASRTFSETDIFNELVKKVDRNDRKNSSWKKLFKT